MSEVSARFRRIIRVE